MRQLPPLPPAIVANYPLRRCANFFAFAQTTLCHCSKQPPLPSSVAVNYLPGCCVIFYAFGQTTSSRCHVILTKSTDHYRSGVPCRGSKNGENHRIYGRKLHICANQLDYLLPSWQTAFPSPVLFSLHLRKLPPLPPAIVANYRLRCCVNFFAFVQTTSILLRICAKYLLPLLRTSSATFCLCSILPPPLLRHFLRICANYLHYLLPL